MPRRPTKSESGERVHINENMGGHYEVTLGVMRGTVRLVRGQCTRRALRSEMFALGYSEPFVSGYLDLVQRAIRQTKKKAAKESV